MGAIRLQKKPFRCVIMGTDASGRMSRTVINNPTQLERYKKEQQAKEDQRRAAMTEAQRRKEDDWLYKLRNNIPIPLPRNTDMRTRADRKKLRADAFAAQMGKMTDAYTRWSLTTPEGTLYAHPEDADVEETLRVRVIDLESDEDTDIPLLTNDELVSSAFVRQGLIPTAPYSPSVTFTIRTLEAFRVHDPRVGVKAYVRTLCERHGVEPRPYLLQLFSIGLEVYIAIRTEVEKRAESV